MFNGLRWFISLLTLLVCSCVYVPHTTKVYDTDCQFTLKHTELTPFYVAALSGCKDEQCVGLLAFAGAVTAASVVVSSSVMVIENIAYWLETPDCDKSTRPRQ